MESSWFNQPRFLGGNVKYFLSCIFCIVDGIFLLVNFRWFFRTFWKFFLLSQLRVRRYIENLLDNQFESKAKAELMTMVIHAALDWIGIGFYSCRIRWGMKCSSHWWASYYGGRASERSPVRSLARRFFRRYNFFARTREELLARICMACNHVFCAPGDVMFYQGEPAEGM